MHFPGQGYSTGGGYPPLPSPYQQQQGYAPPPVGYPPPPNGYPPMNSYPPPQPGGYPPPPLQQGYPPPPPPLQQNYGNYPPPPSPSHFDRNVSQVFLSRSLGINKQKKKKKQIITYFIGAACLFSLPSTTSFTSETRSNVSTFRSYFSPSQLSPTTLFHA